MKNPVLKSFPLGFQWPTIDPFLFCVHHKDLYPSGNEEMGPPASVLVGRDIGQDFALKDGFRMYHGAKVPGFPGHPHRGFETITVVREGFVDHADSLGAAGRYGAGDTQWMTAGRGIQHSEMFPLLNKDKGNPVELFQIWLNLPRAKKLAEPHFRMLWRDQVPKVNTPERASVEVIAGTFNGTKAADPTPNSWAADPINQVMVLVIELQAGGSVTLPASADTTSRMLYFYQGSNVEIAKTSYSSGTGLHLAGDIEVKASSAGSAKLLYLQGKPIGEPVAQHGPFVMTTAMEIQQTINEYRKTLFGGWPWDRSDVVHARDSGRFAKHADGKVENPG